MVQSLCRPAFSAGVPLRTSQQSIIGMLSDAAEAPPVCALFPVRFLLTLRSLHVQNYSLLEFRYTLESEIYKGRVALIMVYNADNFLWFL